MPGGETNPRASRGKNPEQELSQLTLALTLLASLARLLLPAAALLAALSGLLVLLTRLLLPAAALLAALTAALVLLTALAGLLFIRIHNCSSVCLP